MARAYINPERRIESLHFTDGGMLAVCDDGTMWTMDGEEWVQIPPVPGTVKIYLNDNGLPEPSKIPPMPEVEAPRVGNFTTGDLEMEMGAKGWIGVDLDGTLAELTDKTDARTIGKPVEAMVRRVKAWMAEGKMVRIVTARVAPGNPEELDPMRQRRLVSDWCLEHLGFTIPVVHGKDIFMIELWDDLVVRVEKNTGKIL